MYDGHVRFLPMIVPELPLSCRRSPSALPLRSAALSANHLGVYFACLPRVCWVQIHNKSSAYLPFTAVVLTRQSVQTRPTND
jgi:hypothetical protein